MFLLTRDNLLLCVLAIPSATSCVGQNQTTGTISEVAPDRIISDVHSELVHSSCCLFCSGHRYVLNPMIICYMISFL